jgi:hypothetical protein
LATLRGLKNITRDYPTSQVKNGPKGQGKDKKRRVIGLDGYIDIYNISGTLIRAVHLMGEGALMTPGLEETWRLRSQV